MLRYFNPGQPFNRRDFMRVGALGLGGLSLANLNRLQAGDSRVRPNDKAIILLWCGGGPSHLETYDLKPDAPSTVRSLFKPIRTRVSGLDVCELLPRHAAMADKFTILRSVAHDEFDHGFGTRRFLTGYRDEMTRGENRKCWYPSVDSGVFRALGCFDNQMPVAVRVGQGSQEYGGPGYWGTRYALPTSEFHASMGRYGVSGGLPGMAPRNDLSEGRLDLRHNLVQQLEQVQQTLQADRKTSTWDVHQRQAFDLLSSTRVREAFALEREPESIRSRYGRDAQNMLVARRLVEAGVRLVEVGVPGKPPTLVQKAMFNWDDHSVNWNIVEAMKMRLPWYDHVVTTLLDDLHQRGLDDKVMVIVTGEFGRSPRLDYSNGAVGRDHWCRAMSILVSGGGRRRGDVIGATNLHGEYPVSRRYDPHDFLATIYHYLGIPHDMEFQDPQGRPVPLTRGTPIHELL